MRIVDKYSHRAAEKNLRNSGNEYLEIELSIQNCDLVFGTHRPNQIKKSISNELNHLGWADRVRILPNSNLTISFLKSQIGVCLQLGNVARTYADLLKLAFLGNRQIISNGVIIVPGSPESRILGENYAHYDRLAREVDIFADILETPLLILSIAN